MIDLKHMFENESDFDEAANFATECAKRLANESKDVIFREYGVALVLLYAANIANKDEWDHHPSEAEEYVSLFIDTRKNENGVCSRNSELP